MTDSSIATGLGGQLLRVLKGLGADSAAQEVFTLADSAGNLLGTSGAPLPVTDAALATSVGAAADAEATGAGSVIAIIPDGMEFSGAQTVGASLAAQATTNIVSVALIGFEY